jgi:hypothetical protein
MTQLDEAHFLRSIDRIRGELASFDADQDQIFFIQTAVEAVITGQSLLIRTIRKTLAATLIFEMQR